MLLFDVVVVLVVVVVVVVVVAATVTINASCLFTKWQSPTISK